MRELMCCGLKPRGGTERGVIVGRCMVCLRLVARVNPKTGDTEKVTDDDAWSDRPREVVMTREEFRARRRA
jgi:hypothetical protein